MTVTAKQPTATQIPMRAVMTAVLLAVGTLGVSQTSVGVVLPVIVSELGGTQSHFGWVLAASMLASVATGPLWAAAATRRRASSMFLAALCVYTAGALLAGLAPTADVLVAIRVLQGCGIGGVFILANIIVSVTSPPERRPRYLGYVAATMSAATLGGPIIGGVIDGIGLDWRWNFYVGFVPATAAIIALAVIFRGTATARPPERRGVDVVGLLLVPAAIAVALVGVTVLADEGGGVLGTALTAGGVALLVVAVVVEARLRSVRAVLPVRLFAQREPASAFWGALALGLLGAVSILLIQYLQYARDVTPLGTSLWTLPIVGCAMVASLWAGARVERTRRYRGVISAGAVGAGVGVLGFAVLPVDWSLWSVSVLCGCIGIGNGLVMQNLTVAAQNSVDTDHLEDATGTVSLMRMLGGAVGMPLYTALYSAVLTSDLTATAGLDAHALPEVSALPPAQLLAYEAATAHAFSVVAWASLPLVGIVAAAGFLTRNRSAPAAGVAPGAIAPSHTDGRQETSVPHAGTEEPSVPRSKGSDA